MIPLILAGVATAGAPTLLQTGLFHGDEVPAPLGTTKWMALAEGAEGAVAGWVDVVVEAACDPVLDGPGQTTGRKVTVPGQADVLVLVRELQGLTEGRVPTWEIGPMPITAPLTVGPLVLEVREEPRALLLRAGDIVQVVAKPGRTPSGPWPVLHWAGDWDGDGKPDLLVDLADHSNVSAVTLFLSSKAGEGEFVAQVARLETTGC